MSYEAGQSVYSVVHNPEAHLPLSLQVELLLQIAKSIRNLHIQKHLLDSKEDDKNDYDYSGTHSLTH